jgi:Rnl2 family RNA ligase
MRTQWPFDEYDRIPERPEALPLDESTYRAMRRARWVVTEKIHGANFSFVTDGTQLLCAKRKSYLRPGESFYRYSEVRDALRPALLDLFSKLQASAPHALRIALYGELFGGGYPHPEVPRVEGVQPIQSGVYYCPQVAFCGFDLALISPEGRSFLPYDQARALCEASGVLFAAPLRVGSYEEALAYPLGFASTLPARLGLPPVANNKAEGVVIKPNEALYAEEKGQRVRVLLKRKIPEFAEDARFAQAEKWRDVSAGKLSPFQLLQGALPSLCNENRVQSALSKLGPPAPRDAREWSALFQLVREDVLLSLREDYADTWRLLSEDEQDELSRETSRVVAPQLAARGAQQRQQLGARAWARAKRG